jgi:hypothetical protein
MAVKGVVGDGVKKSLVIYIIVVPVNLFGQLDIGDLDNMIIV